MDILFPGLSLLTLFGLYGYWKLTGQNESYVRQLCSGFMFHSHRKKPEDMSPATGWHSYFYGGMYEGRPVEVQYRYRTNIRWPKPEESPSIWQIRDELEIRIPVVQKFWLRMLPQMADIDEQEEIIVEKDLFDRAFRIFSNQREAATEFLQGRLVQEKFRTLPFAMDRLEIHRGWLRLLFIQAQERGLKRSDLESTLDNLILLLTVYENYSYRLEIKHTEFSKICPYCRGEMNENEVSVECQQCSTRLHKACWEENKQCTTWGCNSTQTT